MHETAEEWKSYDPRVQAASETIAREVKEQYGIDVTDPAANPADVRIALAQEELRRNTAAHDGPHPLVAAGAEYAVAAEGLAEVDRLDARAAVERAAAQRVGDVVDPAGKSDGSRLEEAAVLELTARESELQAEHGGTATHNRISCGSSPPMLASRRSSTARTLPLRRTAAHHRAGSSRPATRTPRPITDVRPPSREPRR